jgi:hypothetical protein
MSALSAWVLGYPEQAVRGLETARDHARRRGHPFDLGWAVTLGAHPFDFLHAPDEWLKRIEEADRLGRENSLPFLTRMLVPACSGLALMRKDRSAEGVASLESGLALYEKSGGNFGYFKSVLAEGMAQRGNLAGALHLIDEVIAREERYYYAEALRIKGSVLFAEGRSGRAECAYLASLDWARTQQAKSCELRTATSYARLLRDQGRAREAHDLLAPIYGWFTEGFCHEEPEGRQGALGGTRCAGADGAPQLASPDDHRFRR